jgi:hypothetical protein
VLLCLLVLLLLHVPMLCLLCLLCLLVTKQLLLSISCGVCSHNMVCPVATRLLNVFEDLLGSTTVVQCLLRPSKAYRPRYTGHHAA